MPTIMMDRFRPIAITAQSAQRIALCGALALLLAACGVRGPLEAPTPAEVPEGEQPSIETQKDDRFILDGLLL